jgi:hypothetical protein
MAFFIITAVKTSNLTYARKFNFYWCSKSTKKDVAWGTVPKIKLSGNKKTDF